VTVTRLSETVTVTDRADPSLTPAESRIVAEPRPDAGARLAHEASVAAAQVQLAWAPTSIWVSPPSAGSVDDRADRS
jgi:hypothetical protein